jgi:hypothetical protein
MTTQQNLFDKARATEARDAALDMVERGASKMWIDAALDSVRRVCLKHAEFTTDDVWAELVLWCDTWQPPEPRAMGAVMRAACQLGLCTRSDRTRNSNKVSCHRRPLRIWIST